MKRPKKISLMCENMEEVVLDMSEVIQLGIRGIKEDVIYANEAWCSYQECETFLLATKSKIDRVMRFRDLTSIALIYGDNESIVIDMPWYGDDMENEWQSNKVIDGVNIVNVKGERV